MKINKDRVLPSLAGTGLAIVTIPLLIGALNAFPRRTPSQDAPRPTFGAASIKPSAPGVSGGGTSIGKGGSFTATNLKLKQLIQIAYRLQAFQIVGGPPWAESETFDINARPEAVIAPELRTNPNSNPVLLMLQSLLADRFQVKLHREVREIPVFSLVVGKSGAKLVKAANPTDDSIRSGRGRIIARAIDMASLAKSLGQELGRPVLDKTGLQGKYDLTLEWTPELAQSLASPDAGGDSRPLPEASGPSIYTAIQEQLGLRLESDKGPVDVLVIDHAEQPSEN